MGLKDGNGVLQALEAEPIKDPVVNFAQPSSIDLTNIDCLNSWLGSNDLNLELVYRMSQHGSKKAAFDAQVQGVSPSLILIKSESGQVFGAYTSIPWKIPDTNDECYIDKTAFLFSLTQRSKHQPYQNTLQTVRFWRDQHLFFFGGGCDLAIGDQPDRRKDSWTNLGYTFEPPAGTKALSDAAKRYLAGDYCFKVRELEVFKVIIS